MTYGGWLLGPALPCLCSNSCIHFVDLRNSVLSPVT